VAGFLPLSLTKDSKPEGMGRLCKSKRPNSSLAETRQQEAALSQLLALVGSASERICQQVSYALKPFDSPQVKEALSQLRQDSNHQVVAVTLEDLL
jgi:LmbE family N-acetylglucosaminyl deacetylase